MKKFSWLFIVLLILDFGLLLYTNRANLSSPYDATYWKDRYDHSQWQLPLSTRTLGDNGLYAYEGYELVGGADPTKYNAEIPPLGKYAIGAIIHLTGNSSWFGVISSLAVGVLFFLLAKKILKSTTFALVAAAWLSCDLLFLSQWTATMLDMLHLAALLLFFILLGESAWLPGLALGIFSAIKYPFFSVILLGAGGYYVWKKTHSLQNPIVLFVSAITIYILSYTRYFLFGQTFVDWLRLQKWMFAFWSGSTLSSNIGSVWTTILANRYQNLFTRVWEPVPQWSLSWPIIVVLTGYTAYRSRKNVWPVTIWISIFLIMLVYTFIPFWTRYLLLIVPFLYIGAAAAIRTLKSTRVILIFVFLLLAFNAYTAWRGVFPTPKADVEQFVYDWKNGFFQDMYERFTMNTKGKSDRYAFLRTMQQVTRDGEIEATAITILPTAWKQFTNPQYIPLRVTYSTRHLGEFTQTIKLPVVRENGLWRIPWKPEYFISGFARGDSLKTTVVPGRRGTIFDQARNILAQDVPGFMIWITPKLVDVAREQAMLKYLETLFGYPRFSAVNFYHRYSINSQPDVPVPIAVLPATIFTPYPGITLTHVAGRYETREAGIVGNTHYAECCSYLYNTTTYDGISGQEQLYNARLKGESGGSLVIIDSAGKIIQTLINKDKKDGEDVLL